jgi:Fic family protein
MDIEGFNGKMGRVQQATKGAFHTFEPNPLPCEITYDTELVKVLSNALTSVGNLSGIGYRMSNPHLLITPYLKKEAVFSSKIEGTRTTLSELFINETGEEAGEKDDVQEVINYVKALEFGLNEIKSSSINEALIKRMHAILLTGVRGEDKDPGQYKVHQNWIGRSNDIMEADFIPASPESVPRLMKNLDIYINEYEAETSLIKSGVLHYQFETIHPFRDGNGRIGRLLITLFLCKTGLLSQPLLYLSAYLEKERDSYYDLLLDLSKNGNIESWLKFYLKGVTIQSNDALERSIKLEEYKMKCREILQEKTRSIKVLQILDHLFINPFVKIPEAAKIIGSHYPTAESNIATLVDLGILEEFGDRKKERIYQARTIREILEK